MTLRMRKFRRRVFNKYFVGKLCWKILRTVIIFGLCFVILYPFFATFIDTFKSVADLNNHNIRYIPRQFTMEHFHRIIDNMDYLRTLGITVVFCGAVAILQTFSSALIAYGFARFKFRGRGILFAMVIMTLVIPPQTMILSLFTRFRFFMGIFNLINTPYPLLIMAATGLGIMNGLYIFMYRQYFRNLPLELEEAAYIDGCGTLKTFVKIIVPASTTIMITVFLLSFSWQWTDTVYVGIFSGDIQLMTNRVGGIMEMHRPAMDIMLRNSSAILAVIPLAFVYILLQNFFIQGIERSGITG